MPEVNIEPSEDPQPLLGWTWPGLLGTLSDLVPSPVHRHGCRKGTPTFLLLAVASLLLLVVCHHKQQQVQLQLLFEPLVP